MGVRRLAQYLVASAVALAGVTLGVSSGWTTTVLPKFHNNETIIYITDQEISWVAAIASPGYMTGSLTSSFIADKFGRRSAILSSALPIIIGTIMILSTATVWWLYIARFLWGIGMGIIGTISSIYLAEVSDKEVRGTITSSFRYMMSFGNFLTMAVGSFVSFENITCLLLVLPLAYFSACCFIPETPYYLLKEGKLKEARAALLKLSSNKEDWIVEDRLSAMRLDVKKDMQSSSSIKELFTGKRYRKALIISIGLKITQIMSGTLAILQYLGRIFQESNTNINLSTALMVFGAVRFVVGIFSSVIVDKVGRRPLFISSYLGSSMALTTIGLYFFLQPTFSIFSSYIPFFGLMIISTIISIIGYDTLCFVITAEIFPLNVKSVAMTFQNILGGFLNFLVVKGYQEVKDVAGLTGVFWFFACSSLTGAVFSFFLVPETKGKSLREIQIELQGELYDEVDKSIPNGVVKDDDDATELKELKPDNT
ncbi:facilitated trehalose transporter Tret1-like [Helicoverpa zea]|uniref:facilitated trehalose transporter Tret1-like n=1 Tax=Helicoverpa zea TaxID=7113 RepID=UPI001F5632BB|nr:facilitated trehalose transporter Tret1-like [Helicoverpa zea]